MTGTVSGMPAWPPAPRRAPAPGRTPAGPPGIAPRRAVPRRVPAEAEPGVETEAEAKAGIPVRAVPAVPVIWIVPRICWPETVPHIGVDIIDNVHVHIRLGGSGVIVLFEFLVVGRRNYFGVMITLDASGVREFCIVRSLPYGSDGIDSAAVISVDIHRERFFGCYRICIGRLVLARYTLLFAYFGKSSLFLFALFGGLGRRIVEVIFVILGEDTLGYGQHGCCSQ